MLLVFRSSPDFRDIFSIGPFAIGYKIECLQRFTVQMPDSENPSITLPGTVEKIIKPAFPGDPERAQISVEGGDHLYRELRIENSMTNPEGQTVSLKEGAEVNVILEAAPEDTILKPDQTLAVPKAP